MDSPEHSQTSERSDRSGYTLTEMLIVIAIISLLAAVLTPTLFGQLARARARAAAMQLETITSSLEMMRSDIGRYPTAQEGLTLLLANPLDAAGWLGPYANNDKAIIDPWGRRWVYEMRGDAGYRVMSLGQDGKPGGKSVDADLTAER